MAALHDHVRRAPGVAQGVQHAAAASFRAPRLAGALAGLFTTAVELTGTQRSVLMFPLCWSIALVYKTTHCEHPRDVPVAALFLWMTIVIGMYAVGVGKWAAFNVMVGDARRHFGGTGHLNVEWGMPRRNEAT